MTANKHPTAPVTELFDPLVRPAPGGDLLRINPGGVLIIGPWRRVRDIHTARCRQRRP